jgi:hypothetical protein
MLSEYLNVPGLTGRTETMGKKLGILLMCQIAFLCIEKTLTGSFVFD